MQYSDDGKILKVGRSPEVSWSLPHLPPPLTVFSAGAETYYFKFQGGGILTGGAYSQVGHTHRWGICPTCFETGGAYAMHPLPHGCARLCL